MADNCAVWNRGAGSDCASTSSPPPHAASPPPPADTPPSPADSPPPPPASLQNITYCQYTLHQVPTDGFSFPQWNSDPGPVSGCAPYNGYVNFCYDFRTRLVTAFCTTNVVNATCAGPNVIYTGPASLRCENTTLVPVSCVDPANASLVKMACM